MRLTRKSVSSSSLLLTLLASTGALAADLILDGGTATLGGTQTFGKVVLLNGARLNVLPFDGTNRATTGNLVLKADSISVDATSVISAKAAGYSARLCLDGAGPSAFPNAGGRGGCGVFDSAGGGGHFGAGGRGTKDTPMSYPTGYEENCVGAVIGSVCVSATDCRTGDGLPTVAGQAFVSSPWSVEFGAAGGDKGCRDGDGFTPSSGTTVALSGGNGGGRLVLVAANAGQTGTISIAGTLLADGARGCASGNDSGGGGAGGSVVLVGDTVNVASTALLSASGGRGGDNQPKCLTCTMASDCASGQSCVNGRCSPCNCAPCTTNAQCLTALGQTCKPLGGSLGLVCADATNQCTPVDAHYDERECKGTQNTGTADDCGGGGGGGEVRVFSRVSTLSPLARITVGGGLGGANLACTAETTGSGGALQLDGAYQGELCDGVDNDFNGLVDDGLPALSCNGVSLPSCVNGVPQSCPANTPSCVVPATDSRPRALVLVDSSAQMLLDSNGVPTFGDGTPGHLGVDTGTDSDTTDGNNSRLLLARNTLNRLVAGYPDLDLAFARFHQDVGVNRSCNTASWLECAQLCCSYDDPRNNVPPAFPLVPGCVPSSLYPNAGYPAALGSNVNEGWPSQADCINYAGSCGPPRRGADVLVGFGKPLRQTLMWIDGKETNFSSSTTPGDHCNFAGGGDCELRATGPRPLAGALDAIADYLKPLILCDAAALCRSYTVLLFTSGADACQGDPVASAAALHALVPGVDLKVWVVNLGAPASDQAQLDAIAAAGGTASALSSFTTVGTTIFAGLHAKAETCNGLDDTCDGRIDETFPDKGQACDDGKLGVCKATGVQICNVAGDGTRCQITAPGAQPSTERCNGLDDDCDGLVDEDGVCDLGPCSKELCNGRDDDCNGLVDDDPLDANQPCGSKLGECAQGLTACVAGAVICQGAIGPTAETCNGLDDDCDGLVDDLPPASCYQGPAGTLGVGQCKAGVKACTASVGSGVPSFGACKGDVQPDVEVCDGLDNDCNGAVDDLPGLGAECATTQACLGTKVCDPASGTVVCVGSHSGLEVCNGLDDDCDGTIDDPLEVAKNDPSLGVACQLPVAPANLGPCKAGAMACVDGAARCVGAVVPSVEVCDGVDNDCDGVIDPPGSCASGLTCHQGACLATCTVEADCPGDFSCLGGLCQPSPDAGSPDAGAPSVDAGLTDAGNPVAVADAGHTPAATASGCSCRGAPELAPWVFALLAMLGLRTRRSTFALLPVDEDGEPQLVRRPTPHQGIVLALLTATLLSCGGSTKPTPADASTPDDAGAALDAGVAVDAGACTADTSTEVANCGACGHACELFGAFSKCVAGACLVDHCGAGHVDLDGLASNGCEYACAPTNGGVERCDGLDNDCDGVVDDGFDLEHDPSNCGACGHQCALTHAQADCQPVDGGAACVVASCEAGYADLDHRSENGCEYGCPVSPPVAESCNELDDDCDGLIDDGNPGGGASCASKCPGGVCLGECAEGQTSCVAGSLLCVGGKGPSLERCDGLDNDCNGVVDDGFDLQNDVANCGQCGHACAFANGFARCQQGQCVLTGCQEGFASVDKDTSNGCEYACPRMPPTVESCNGIDDDCNGLIDDAASLTSQKPDSAGCNPKPGTPCAGADFVCAGKSGWRCSYGPGVELDASGHVAATETRCDGLDGNCNGQIDESFGSLGASCDNGLLGACRDEGRVKCDPTDATRAICDLSVLPDPVPGAPMAETCNGLDDDCNGQIDDGVTDDLVHLSVSSLSFSVDRYEASHPDATATDAGVSTARRCTVPGALPWTNATQAQAAAACAASGARLCTSLELQAACEDGAANLYPYGNSYQPLTCNGLDLDGVPGGANDDLLLPTGSPALAACTTGSGVKDLSGNAAEWTSTVTGAITSGVKIYVVHGGSYLTPPEGLTCQFTSSQYTADQRRTDVGFRCCHD